MKAEISRDADLQRLAKNVVKQAIIDLCSGHPVKSLDALLWFTYGNFPIFAEVWGIPFADPFQMLPNATKWEAAYGRKDLP